MLVKDWMSKSVITTQADEKVSVAAKIMTTYSIGVLPVVKDRKLVGIITKADIRKPEGSRSTSPVGANHSSQSPGRTVADIMTREVRTVSVLNTIGETIDVFRKHHILNAPVVNEYGDIVGIITKTDVFNALISLTTMDIKGIDIGIRVEDRPGSIKEITDIIRSCSGRIASILASCIQAPVGYRNVHIRAYRLDREQLRQVRQRLIKANVLRYIIDSSEDIRELFG